MKKTIVSVFSTFFLISTFYLSNTFAEFQQITQLGLPEGAKAHLGKGYISGNITYSPDGTRLAVASAIGIWLYDAETGEALNLLTGHTKWVNSVVFSPDGQTLASGSYDTTVRLWDVETGENIKTLMGHTYWVESVSFSPDGKTLASASRDGPVRLWDAQTGEPLQTLTGHRDRVSSVSFSPDGETLASASDDGTVFLWQLTPSAMPNTPDKTPEDVNLDGVVNIQDLVVVAANLGQTGTNVADVNADGNVNIQDLVLVAAALGNAAAAPDISHLNPATTLTKAEVTQWLHHAQQGSHRPDFSTRHPFLRTPLSSADTQRDRTFAELSEPFQPWDVDSVSTIRACGCHTDNLRHPGARRAYFSFRTSTRRYL